MSTSTFTAGLMIYLLEKHVNSTESYFQYPSKNWTLDHPVKRQVYFRSIFSYKGDTPVRYAFKFRLGIRPRSPFLFMSKCNKKGAKWIEFFNFNFSEDTEFQEIQVDIHLRK